ncbi:MAG: hypothetical protein JNL30_05200 [Rubrivivax sp.]|nr:hypothetical protein [Rubrivivax sp.]
MEAQPITVALIDATQGYEATPERVRLSALADFTRDVADFLRGQARELDPGSIEVAIQSGSVQVITQPIALAPTLFRDLRSLLDSELIDSLDARRREVIERWQKLARATKGWSYRVAAPFLPRPVVVNAQTDFRADDADQWVRVERYVRGEILDLGGATKANAHVRLPDGTTLRVGTERDVLRDDTVNRLYKPAMLRIQAQYNVLTRELRDARLVEFVQYEPRFDAAELERLNRRGAQAWKDVADASAWVEELRGGVE